MSPTRVALSLFAILLVFLFIGKDSFAFLRSPQESSPPNSKSQTFREADHRKNKSARQKAFDNRERLSPEFLEFLSNFPALTEGMEANHEPLPKIFTDWRERYFERWKKGPDKYGTEVHSKKIDDWTAEERQAFLDSYETGLLELLSDDMITALPPIDSYNGHLQDTYSADLAPMLRKFAGVYRKEGRPDEALRTLSQARKLLTETTAGSLFLSGPFYSSLNLYPEIYEGIRSGDYTAESPDLEEWLNADAFAEAELLEDRAFNITILEALWSYDAYGVQGELVKGETLAPLQEGQMMEIGHILEERIQSFEDEFWFAPNDPDQPSLAAENLAYWQSRDLAPEIVQRLGPLYTSYESFGVMVVRNEGLVHIELALAEARQNGEHITTLKDLIPNYLPELPDDPLNIGEPFLDTHNNPTYPDNPRRKKR